MLPEFNGDVIQWLRGFYYTATTGSMSAATEQMRRNQSAITHQIRGLEKEFGVKLFSGTKNNRVLTEEGKYLLKKTIELFSVINEIRSHISALPSYVHGEVILSAMYSAFNYYLPPVISRFSAIYPDVKLRISGEVCQGDLYEKLHARSADLGIISADDISNQFHSEPLFTSELVLITPDTYPLPHDRSITLEEISRLPIIAPPLNSTLWIFITRQFKRYGINLQYKHTVGQQEAIKEYVAQGIGVSILDKFACNGEIMNKIRVHDISNFIPPRQYYLIWRRDSAYSYPHVSAFIDFLLKEESQSAGIPAGATAEVTAGGGV